MSEKCTHHHCVLCFGLAFGLTIAVAAFLLGIASMLGWGNIIVSNLSSVWAGYGSTVQGSLIGALWGFLDGFLGGVLFASLYNLFSRKH